MSYNLKMENGNFVLTPVPKRQDFDLNMSLRNLNSQMSYLRSVVVATLNKIANLEVKIDLMNKNFIRATASNIPSDKSTSQKTGGS